MPDQFVIPPEVRLAAVLGALDEWAAGANGDYERAKDLWNVLTALRGPDEEDEEEMKLEVTGYVRALALPRTAAKVLAVRQLFEGRARPAMLEALASGIAGWTDKGNPGRGHYIQHARNALWSLRTSEEAEEKRCKGV